MLRTPLRVVPNSRRRNMFRASAPNRTWPRNFFLAGARMNGAVFFHPLAPLHQSSRDVKTPLAHALPHALPMRTRKAVRADAPFVANTISKASAAEAETLRRLHRGAT